MKFDLYIPETVRENMLSIVSMLAGFDNPPEDHITIMFTETITSSDVSSMTINQSELIGVGASMIGSSTVGILYPDSIIQVVSWTGGDSAYYVCDAAEDINDRRPPTVVASKILSTYPLAYALKQKVQDMPIERVEDFLGGMSLLGKVNDISAEALVPAAIWAIMGRPSNEVIPVLGRLSNDAAEYPDIDEIYRITGCFGTPDIEE